MNYIKYKTIDGVIHKDFYDDMIEEIDLSCREIRKIIKTKGLEHLQILILFGNDIKKIKGFENLRSLRELHLDFNEIKKIDGLENITNLQLVHLNHNKIKEIPLEIMNLKKLRWLTTDVSINPIIERYLIKNRSNKDKIMKMTIYDDPENIHNNQINKSITDSLYRLMEETQIMTNEKTMREIIRDPILTQSVKNAIVEYSQNSDVHSALNVTFMETLGIIWQIIKRNKQADEIKRILNQEIQDSIEYCFTGVLSRLINCLNGFDERIEVRISDLQEIANLIIVIRRKYDKLKKQIKMVRKEMMERGYEKDIITEWLSYLD